MTISSRTPEGDPNNCPICGKNTATDPSTVPTFDAPCPHCGSLLWFTKGSQSSRVDNYGLISRLANEIAQLLDLPLVSKDYYGEFLQRVLTAMAAPAGAVWLGTTAGNLQLEYQINMRQVGLDEDVASRESHFELLRQAVMRGQPGLLAPHSGLAPAEEGKVAAGNPTDYVILLAPMIVDKKVAGVIEVWQDPNRGTDAQRGFLQFLVRVAGTASVYAGRTAKAEVSRV